MTLSICVQLSEATCARERACVQRAAPPPFLPLPDLFGKGIFGYDPSPRR